MPLGDLAERRTWSHARPAVGEVDLEAGASKRSQCSQSEGSFQAGPRVSVVQCEAAQVDERLTAAKYEIRQPAGEGSLPYLDCGHGLILLFALAEALGCHSGAVAGL
jgi:hypothetical protein